MKKYQQSNMGMLQRTILSVAVMAAGIAAPAQTLAPASSSGPASSPVSSISTDSPIGADSPIYKRGDTFLESTLPPAPQAASVVKFADIPFLYSTGAARIDIPFHELKGREISIPIGLNYTCGGIKLDEIAGVSGLGWTLNAGGCITRTVMDMPDEFSSASMQHGLPSAPLLAKLLDEDNRDTDKVGYLTRILLHTCDSRLDRYSYSVCGLNGSFVIQDSGDVFQLSGDGVKISYLRSTDGQIASFTVTGPDGTRYLFEEKEVSTHDGTSGRLPDVFTGEEDRWSATTAWYVTSITSRSGNEQAVFTYADGGLWSHNVSPRSTNATVTNGGYPYVSYSTSGSMIVQSCNTRKLESISLLGESVNFTYHGNTGRVGHSGSVAYNHPFALSAISATDINGREIKRLEAVTSREQRDGRVLLNSLSLKGLGGREYDKWSFAYNTRSESVSHFSQDWYGYYNGAEASSNDYAPYHFNAMDSGTTLSGAPDSSEASYMSMSSYNHNGAVSDFTYEGNAIHSTNIGVRVRSISTCPGGAAGEGRVRSFLYESPFADGDVLPLQTMYMTMTPPYTPSDMLSGSRTWSFTYHETPVVKGPSIRDTRVYYGKVTEQVTSTLIGSLNPKIAKTVRYFDTSKSRRATLEARNSVPSGIYTLYSANPPRASIADPLDGIHTSYADEGPVCQPVLTREEEYEWNEDGTMRLASSVDFEYDAPSRRQILVDYVAEQLWHPAGVGNMSYENLFHYPVYATSLLTRQRTKETRVQYHPEGRRDSTRTSITYVHRAPSLESPSRPLQESITEGGVSRMVTYEYADSSNEPYAEELRSQHFLSVPVSRSYYVGSPSFSHDVHLPSVDLIPNPDLEHDVVVLPIDTLYEIVPVAPVVPLKREKIEFDYTSASGASLLPSARIEYTEGNESWREDILERDSRGNIQYVKEKGKPGMVILWSYDAHYPVAVIGNSTPQEVERELGRYSQDSQSDLGSNPGSAISIQSITDNPSPGEAEFGALNSLRESLPDACVEVLTFDPGIGVTSSTDANGVKTHFEYDYAGRLAAVKDADGNLVQDYEYDLLDNDSDGLLSILSTVYRSQDGQEYAADKSWFNTLGLRQQDIAISASGNGDDLVTAYESDFMLHDDVKTWLPYPASATGGAFQRHADQSSATFHGNRKAFTSKVYEVSGRDRLLSSALPGYEGEHESTESEDAAVSFPKYVWSGGSASSDGSTSSDGATSSSVEGVNIGTPYSSGEVVKSVSTDADGRVRTVYKDHAGRTLGSSYGDDAPTYYIYDEKDRLRAVAGSGVPMTDTLSMWRYSYDSLGRLSSKGIPGSEREMYEYDAEDRIVAVRWNGAAKEIEYDAFGRVVRSYLSDGNHDRVLLEEHVYAGNLETQARLARLSEEGDISSYAIFSYEYDAKARPVRRETVYPDGGVLTEEFTYNFPGEVIASVSVYSKDGQVDTLAVAAGYDIRGRKRSGTSVLRSSNAGTGSSILAQYRYDALGRPCGSIVTSGNVTCDAADTYTLQGWMNRRAVMVNGEDFFSESLGYDSGSDASYTGLITSRDEVWAGPWEMLNGTENFRYDYAGRLSRASVGMRSSARGKSYEYDPRGNVLKVSDVASAGADYRQYVYDGDRLMAVESVSGGQPGESFFFAHDVLGRMTSDGLSGTRMEYNHMNLIKKVQRGDSTLVNYTYLADGTKLSSLKDSGEGLVYRGPFTYRRLANGEEVLESAVCDEGRLTPDRALIYVTDHLGSVRAVIDGETGNSLEKSDYSSYGERSGRITGFIDGSSTYRDHFTGKEDQMPDFGIPYSDHGARQYSPALRRWMTPDPLSEKYYGLSPYAYCGDNPICRIDDDGMADYFSENGKFLYNDSIDDGKMRIIAEETYNNLLSISIDNQSEMTFNEMLANNSCSFKAQAASMDPSAVLRVINFYNDTGLPLVVEKLEGGNFSTNNRGENGSIQLSVDIEKNLAGPMLSSSYNISNTINGHEMNHAQGRMQGIMQYKKTSEFQHEINAINAQMNHPTWKRTTEGYKKAVNRYLDYNRGMLDNEKNK